jgi:hypothetical protein
MKLGRITTAALFALTMAMPGIAGADFGNVKPQTPQPAIQQTALAPQSLTTLAYYRGWGCANPYFRRHHWWRCR